MLNFMLHSLQPSHGGVNFILAQLYVGVYILMSACNSQCAQYAKSTEKQHHMKAYIIFLLRGAKEYIPNPESLKSWCNIIVALFAIEHVRDKSDP